MHRPEEGGHVVVLQDGLVVVEDGQVGGGLDVEVVGGPGVVVVVDDGEKRREKISRSDIQSLSPVWEMVQCVVCRTSQACRLLW